jgi:hypothetical protein
MRSTKTRGDCAPQNKQNESLICKSEDQLYTTIGWESYKKKRENKHKDFQQPKK